ncbi:uncharacterized protein Z519_08369 [Cladophialophora bantiana CBS 173.52]|uniref:Cupin type-2 domain-containing protein n=1 Tax=Cladophialophora bantiana (strain ATCC 10958 / CBS 173.52 / CDC B-1940 / NIH 8579) TaxID=1442370 RepID=A0A0D2EKQ9_CLAB1|nr:uncharacterized protein Z519_08369 [Cladophialophora bantiana CBS 173.52]KIW90586.1 hypothetical protein Z519_08369 [Cladophialophora bantiana CBS 173.52]
MSLPTTRRIVTGHDSTGKSIIESDITLTPANPLDATGAPPTGVIPGFTNIFRTAGFPAANVQGPWTDVHGKKIGLVDQAGVYCRIVDFPATGPETKDDVNIMHRTQSVDFGVVLKGTITLILDDGSETVMKEGDVCVQRGTNHAWKNVSTENCRVLFVLVPSEPIRNEATGQAFPSTNTAHLEDETHMAQ